MTQTLHLALSAEHIGKLCAELGLQARGPAHLLTALMALQTCIAAHTPPGDRANAAYRDIQEILGHLSEEARRSLLEETAGILRAALMEQDSRAITRAHEALSRNGFWQAVAQVAEKLGKAQIEHAGDWLAAWCREKKSRAQAASPYPDSLDFRAAGIDPKEYAAMDEIRRALDAAGCA